MNSEDCALDMEAGGRGFKGEKNEDGCVHSCFAWVINNYASPEDREALKYVVRFVDIGDSHGSVIDFLAPELDDDAQMVFNATGLNAVLRALQSTHQVMFNPENNHIVLERMSEILFGMLKSGRARPRAAAEAERAELFGDGQVALTTNSREFGTNNVLFSQKHVRVVVYIDGYSLGITRDQRENVCLGDPRILALIEASGEDWFKHSAGWLICRGSRKAPATSPSKVDPRRLVEILVKICQENPRKNPIE